MTTHTHDELNKDPAQDGSDFELPVDLRRRIMELAEREGREPSELLDDVLSLYEEDYDEEWVRGMEEGIRDAEEGRVVPHEEVREWLLSWGTDHEKEPPRCK